MAEFGPSLCNQKAHCKCMQIRPCGNHHYSDCQPNWGKKEVPEAIKYIKAPLRYENGYFWDANNHMIAQMRGWGWIQYKGDLETSAAIQDGIGEFIAQAINEKLKK